MSIAVVSLLMLIVVAIVAIPILIRPLVQRQSATRTGPRTRKTGHARSGRAESRTSRRTTGKLL